MNIYGGIMKHLILIALVLGLFACGGEGSMLRETVSISDFYISPNPVDSGRLTQLWVRIDSISDFNDIGSLQVIIEDEGGSGVISTFSIPVYLYHWEGKSNYLDVVNTFVFRNYGSTNIFYTVRVHVLLKNGAKSNEILTRIWVNGR